MAASTSGLPPQMRAGDADRAHVVSLLRRHFAEGGVTLGELEERTRRACARRTLGELDAPMTDLPPLVVSPPRTTLRPCWRARGVRPDMARYMAVMLLLVGSWALSGRGDLWPAWALLAWGFAIAVRTLKRTAGGPRGSASCDGGGHPPWRARPRPR